MFHINNAMFWRINMYLLIPENANKLLVRHYMKMFWFIKVQVIEISIDLLLPSPLTATEAEGELHL